TKHQPPDISHRRSLTQVELFLPLRHHRDIFVIESRVEIAVKAVNFPPVGRIDSRHKEVHHYQRPLLCQRKRVSPHFSTDPPALKRGGDPSAQLTLKPKFEHQAALFVVGLWPYTRTEAPCAGCSALDLCEAAAMEMGKVLPIDRVLVEPL